MAWPRNLCNWFQTAQRAMPWRAEKSPYRTWVSEIMLQQTQVDTVIPYFNRFMEIFPTVHHLAKSELEPILKQWEGLGYYSRARNLHKAAKLISKDLNGQIPDDYKSLQKIPGIGPYCGAAIASIAYEKPIPVVDGNVLRVFTRFWAIHDDIRLPKVRDALFKRLEPFIKEQIPSVFNQAIMELGALICTPRSPKCTKCPIQNECKAHQENLTGTLPFKSKKAKVPHYNIGIGVIWKNNKVLIAKRKETQMLGGLWEFPGGKQKENEDIEDTVLREIKEETSLSITVKQKYGIVNHAYSHFKITLHVFRCEYKSGTAIAKSADTIKWESLNNLENYPFPTANKKIFSDFLLSQT